MNLHFFFNFALVNMGMNYAEIDGVGKLQAGFQQVLLVQILSSKNQQKINKNYLLSDKKNTRLEKLHSSDQVLAINLILG